MFRAVLFARVFGALVAVSVVAGTASAVPIVIDFESLRVDSAASVIVHGTSYTENGFVLSVTCCEPVAGPQETDLRTVGTLALEYAGSTAMHAGKSNSLLTLSTLNGNPFDLLSIDLAAFPGTVVIDGVLVPIDTGLPIDIAFEGLGVGGNIVTQSFSHSDFLNLTTYYFNGFSELASVSWYMGAEAHQFDNIRAVSVPEPGTLSLLGAGLIALFGARRRNARC